jgi:WD40 repeat protein
LTSSIDGSVRRYDYYKKKCTNIYYKYDGCRSLVLSVNEKHLCVSGITDNKAKVLDMETGLVKNEFMHQDSIRCVEFAQIGGKQYWFTAGWDRIVNQWDYESGVLLNSYDAPGRICDLKISNDGKLFIGYYERDKMGGFKIIDISNGNTISSVQEHFSTERFGRVVVLYITGDFLYTAGDDGLINEWDLNNAIIIRTFECNSGVRAIAIDHELNLLYSGHNDSYIRVWNLNTSNLLYKIDCEYAYVFSLASTKKYLFVGDETGRLIKYDKIEKEVVKILQCHTLKIWELRITNDEETIITASEDGKVKFISIDKMEERGAYYNLADGFLWTASQEGKNNSSYYWTNRLGNINVYEENPQLNKTNNGSEETRIKEYHSIYNKQKIVMGQINNSKFYGVYKAAANQIKQKKEVTKLLGLTSERLLK